MTKLAFKGERLCLGRAVLGAHSSHTVRPRKLRTRLGKPTKRKGKAAPTHVRHLFEPTAAGEKLGIVRLFACKATVVSYVSDFLLKQGKLTQQEWRAARRA